MRSRTEYLRNFGRFCLFFRQILDGLKGFLEGNGSPRSYISIFGRCCKGLSTPPTPTL